MNTHRIALEVGRRHFQQNPMGTLHRAVSESSIVTFRRARAADAMEHVVHGTVNEALGDGEPRTNPCLVTWRVAMGASTAAHALRKVDNGIDAVFGTCLAQRSTARPGWESEGFFAQLGKLPLHGLTLVGAKLGAAYDAISDADDRQAAANGARLGAIVGGAMAYAWSQGLAFVGFAAKMLLRVPATAYMTLVQSFDDMDKQLAQDALLGTGARLRTTLNPFHAFSTP